MKFRNPQTGKIYDFEGKERLTSGFCVGIPCKACPIRRHRGKMSCRDYFIAHQVGGGVWVIEHVLSTRHFAPMSPYRTCFAWYPYAKSAPCDD